MRSITVLVDSIEYSKKEIYQQHIHSVLSKKFDTRYIELHKIGHEHPGENVMICTRFRNTAKFSREISSWLGDRKSVAIDFDPWVFFDDQSPYRGSYERVSQSAPNLTFAVPNNFWAKIIESRTGRRVNTFRLGVPPDLCKYSSWESRDHRLEFRGSSYPVREKCFKNLSRHIPVNWDREVLSPYDKFLEFLSGTRVWAQDESEPVFVDGVPYCRNWLWPKAIEVISRGCFLIRDAQEEADWYGISSQPTVFLYRDVSETPRLLEEIECMSISEKNDRIEKTVEWVRQQNFYELLGTEVENWFK